ncbi:MAG: Uma2 family endonuclease [Cyanobacteriota bacterium]|nr:Uma2 family endonuclease [Cyanobacteriota bacterium]
MSNLTIRDLEQIQNALQEAGIDRYQLELDRGELAVMGPSDIISSETTAILLRLLGNWVYPRRWGRLFDSAGGFILPNRDLKAPDVSFVKAERLPRSIRYFAELVPDLVVEVKSQSDRIPNLEAKIRLFIELGATVGLLVDPDLETVTIYRSQQPEIVLGNDDTLTLQELFPGWELPVGEIWPEVFDFPESEEE